MNSNPFKEIMHKRGSKQLFQNLTLLPFPTMEGTLLLKTFHLFLIAFQKLTPYPSLSIREQQSSPSFPDFSTINHPLPHRFTFCGKSLTPLAQQIIIESGKLPNAKPPTFLCHTNNRPPE